MFDQYLDTSMEIGDSQRYFHCPWHGPAPGGALVVIRNEKGWVLYCHNCKRKKFIKDGKLSANQVLTKLNKIQNPERDYTVDTVYLPRDFVYNLPYKAIKWLRKYNITDTEIKAYRFGYSEFRDRLIMPVFDNDGVVYWQGRNLDTPTKKNPKYVNVKSKRADVLFETKDDNKTYVIVEDILSAIAMGRAGYHGVSILGSAVTDDMMSIISKRNPDRVVVWLDPDKRKEAVKYAKRLSVFGIRATALVTPEKDPKEYLTDEVRKFIESGVLRDD